MTRGPRELLRGLRRRVDRILHGRAGLGASPAPEAERRRGRPPAAELQHTHLGPELDEAVLRATRRMRVGVDPDYDLVQANFDVLHYLLQAPRVVERPGIDVVGQFIDEGVELNRDPSPHFSLSNYLAAHPEHADGPERSPYLEWLKRGRARGEIADPAPRIPAMAQVLGLEPAEAAALVAERRRDLIERFRTGRLGEMMERAAAVEPLVAATWTELARVKLLPLSTPAVTGQVAAIHRAQELAGFRRARLVLVINRPRWGGGRRIEGHLTHALAERIDPAEIVVVYTDDSNDTPPGRYPDGVREIDFGRLVADLTPEQAQTALVALLRSFHADAVVNINSRMLYHALRTYGHAMAASERIFLTLFCNEKSATGVWQGWSLGYFYRAFEYAAGVITDSEHLSRHLAETYRVPAEHLDRLHVFRAPVDGSLPTVSGPGAGVGRRPQVFWAGRWDRQKRIDLFFAIARRMPDVDFRMWGAPVMGERQRQVPSNVVVEGQYAHISQIPLDEADAWLYTSAWDGVPSQLLEVSMTGIPIVGTLVGGTGEVIGGEDAWAVGENDGAEAYEQALRAVLADPSDARRKATALRERLLAERTPAAFADQARRVLLVDRPAEEATR